MPFCAAKVNTHVTDLLTFVPEKHGLRGLLLMLINVQLTIISAALYLTRTSDQISCVCIAYPSRSSKIESVSPRGYHQPVLVIIKSNCIEGHNDNDIYSLQIRFPIMV